LTISKVPDNVTLRARRLERLRESLRETILEGAFDEYRSVVEALTKEHGPVEVALAAIKQLQQLRFGGAEHDDLPNVSLPTPERDAPSDGPRRPSRPRPTTEGKARLFIGAGRALGIAARDLVGAIANEANLNGRAVTIVEIAERFSLVEVPDEDADHVIVALKAARIKGRKVVVRRDRERVTREE
jgi:ATP-dependent RNA helicase DeaD